MPEGPQVHLIAQTQDRLFGRKKLSFSSPDGRSAEIVDAFDGRKLQAVTAFGKHLVYRFTADHQLHIHLGRFGKFRGGEVPVPAAQTNLRLQITSATHWLELRGATAIEHYCAADVKRLQARLGPDPLNGDEPNAGFEKIIARRAPLGQLLMDQSIIAGIGNIFRAELLFRAGISPYRPGNTVTLAQLQRIWDDANIVMLYSMEHEGRIVTTEPGDRSSPKRPKVARTDAFYVYHRTGKPCRRCGTAIEDDTMGGRSVFFCPHCQPLQEH